MTTLKVCLIALAIFVAGLFVGLGTGVYVTEARVAARLAKQELKVSTTLHKADTNALTQRAEDGKALAQNKERANEAVSNSIRANPEWASQPVPDDVIDAIGM